MKARFVFPLLVSGLIGLFALNSGADVLDSITFGDAASEAAHKFADARSEKISGGLGESARRLLAPLTENWEGGRMSFTLAVDSVKPNYATIKLWGSDATKDVLILFCEGKQIGYRHLGDIDVLDIGGGNPAFVGRFIYTTTPLPIELTRGKTNLSCEIRSTGPTWGYGTTFAQYQKPMTEPTRGIYKFYSHTDGTFTPPADEKQGVAPQNPPVAKSPGAEVLDQIKKRVNGELDARLNSKSPCSQMQLQLLAKAYDVEWTRAYKNPKAIEQIVKGLDALFAAYRKDPKLAQAEPSTWNPDWFGLGICGQVIALRKAELASQLNEKIEDGRGGKISRRAAYTEMLVACRDWHRKHRRQYTNQTMLNDLNGIYHANRGIAVLTPDQAVPEQEVRRYLYESVALESWRDSDQDGDSPRERNWAVGTNYWQLTAKGLSKELGYVGSYGEVIDLVADIYNATRPAPDQPGDERIKAQLIKVAHARANFRYPSLDADGNRVMRLEQVVGWRDNHFPGYLTYAQRATRDASALQAAAITLDPQLAGCAQQMIADNQFFTSEVEAMEDKAQPLRTTIGRLETPEQYKLIQAQPPQSKRLPMTPGQPDFVFSDEEDGVVAIKNGGEILYVSLYWRARSAVNFLARVHFTTPTMDCIAVVREEAEFERSGEFYTRPDWVNFGFGNGGPKYPVEMRSAHAGEKLPIAKVPEGIRFRPGSENVFAGKADFYTLRYGDYLISMNMSAAKTFELKPPAPLSEARELVSGKTLKLTAPLKVAPRSTVVLYFGK
ncbi:MAG: hypothetical protein EPO07_12470 [Verrucomicrobia bacterium]|nr:MAG: hypothetical protein EPO07_12470 [Verrucomicrobiota bacterium]